MDGDLDEEGAPTSAHQSTTLSPMIARAIGLKPGQAKLV
jgi:hypothetical protein